MKLTVVKGTAGRFFSNHLRAALKRSVEQAAQLCSRDPGVMGFDPAEAKKAIRRRIDRFHKARRDKCYVMLPGQYAAAAEEKKIGGPYYRMIMERIDRIPRYGGMLVAGMSARWQIKYLHAKETAGPDPLFAKLSALDIPQHAITRLNIGEIYTVADLLGHLKWYKHVKGFWGLDEAYNDIVIDAVHKYLANISLKKENT